VINRRDSRRDRDLRRHPLLSGRKKNRNRDIA